MTTWARIDVGFLGHPKVAALVPTTRPPVLVHLGAILYSAQYETDGYLTPDAIRLVGGTPRVLSALEGAGVWEPNGAGWVIHDFLDYQPSREAREAERERLARDRALARERQRRRREGSA